MGIASLGGAGFGFSGLVEVSSTSDKYSAFERSRKDVAFRPSVDWFFVDRWSLGVGLVASHFTEQQTLDIERAFMTTLDLDAVVPLGKYVVFQVGPSLGFRHTERESSQSIAGDNNSDAVRLSVNAGIGVTLP